LVDMAFLLNAFASPSTDAYGPSPQASGCATLGSWPTVTGHQYGIITATLEWHLYADPMVAILRRL